MPSKDGWKPLNAFRFSITKVKPATIFFCRTEKASLRWTQSRREKIDIFFTWHLWKPRYKNGKKERYIIFSTESTRWTICVAITNNFPLFFVQKPSQNVIRISFFFNEATKWILSMKFGGICMVIILILKAFLVDKINPQFLLGRLNWLRSVKLFTWTGKISPELIMLIPAMWTLFWCVHFARLNQFAYVRKQRTFCF